jgi:hypothetical protein
MAPYVVWDSDPVADTTADQVLAAAKGGDRPANVDAADLLMSLLDMGPMLVRAIEDEAVAAGLLKAGAPIGKDKAFRLARRKLGICRANGTIYREGGTGPTGQWLWCLPATKVPQDA